MFGQDGIVKGTITDNNNTPLEYVNIIIKNFQIGTQSDIDGNYELKEIEIAPHFLTFTSIGYKKREITINVLDNQTTTVPRLTLFEGNEILQEVL